MPKTARKAQRRDLNETALVAAARKLGAFWLPLEAGAGADGILLNRYGVTVYVEVKNPKQPPSKRKLTADEKKTKAEVESRGGLYKVVETEAEMLGLCSLVTVTRPVR